MNPQTPRTNRMMFRSFLLISMVVTQVSVLHSQEEKQRRRMAKEPGKEHEQLKRLAGSWDVSMTVGGKPFDYQGDAMAETILGDRFLVIDGEGKARNHNSAYRFTIGFDRWHSEYVIILMDTSGTHHVTARGKPTDKQIRVRVPDDDPRQKMMGYGSKKFGFDLDIASDDEFSIATLLVNNRTGKELSNLSFRYIFKRNAAGN